MKLSFWGKTEAETLFIFVVIPYSQEKWMEQIYLLRELY